MQREFNGIIFTNHAIERAEQRGISQQDAWATLNNPDSVRYAQDKNKWVYYRTYGDRKVEVVASKNEQNQWVVVSVWDRPHYGPKLRTKMKDPIWKRVLKELFGIFKG
jgi:hypothetical protein